MKFYRNIIFMLLLIGSLHCNTFATENEQDSLKSETELSINYSEVEIDSIVFYEDSIREYSKGALYIQNVIGIIIGLPITTIGSIAFLIGTIGWIGAKGLEALGAALALGFSIPTLLIGVPILVYNVKNYKVHKKRADKRDEYKEALERYKQKQHSVEVAITPVTNLAGSSIGMNAILSF